MTPRTRSGLALVALVLAVGGASEAWRFWSADRLGRDVAALARPGDIEMISSDTCPYCMQARAWFEAHQVAYTECSIERDASCAARYNARLAPGTPLLFVRGQAQLGFSPQRVAQALAPVTGR